MINRKNWAKLLVITLFLIPTVCKSQKVCSEALSEAENMYDMGRLYEISELLHDCIENGFTREEKVRAYKLLSIVNLYLDQFAEADQTYLALLKLNPEYQPNPLIDPAELIYLHDQFNTTPKWSLILGSLGMNLTQVKVINSYSLDGLGDLGFVDFGEPGANVRTNDKNYSLSAGLSLGAGIEYNFTDRLSAGSGVWVNSRRFKVRENLLKHSSQPQDQYSVSYSFNEDQYAAEIPLYLKFGFPEMKFKPYIIGGIAFSYLWNAQANNLRLERSQDETLIPVTGPGVSVIDNRRAFNYALLFGAGIRYKIDKNYLALELRMNAAFKNMVKANARYSNPEMLYPYMYVDDDMRLNVAALSLSYIRPLYNPRKRK